MYVNKLISLICLVIFFLAPIGKTDDETKERRFLSKDALDPLQFEILQRMPENYKETTKPTSNNAVSEPATIVTSGSKRSSQILDSAVLSIINPLTSPRTSNCPRPRPITNPPESQPTTDLSTLSQVIEVITEYSTRPPATNLSTKSPHTSFTILPPLINSTTSTPIPTFSNAPPVVTTLSTTLPTTNSTTNVPWTPPPPMPISDNGQELPGKVSSGQIEVHNLLLPATGLIIVLKTNVGATAGYYSYTNPRPTAYYKDGELKPGVENFIEYRSSRTRNRRIGLFYKQQAATVYIGIVGIANSTMSEYSLNISPIIIKPIASLSPSLRVPVILCYISLSIFLIDRHNILH